MKPSRININYTLIPTTLYKNTMINLNGFPYQRNIRNSRLSLCIRYALIFRVNKIIKIAVCERCY